MLLVSRCVGYAQNIQVAHLGITGEGVGFGAVGMKLCYHWLRVCEDGDQVEGRRMGKGWCVEEEQENIGEEYVLGRTKGIRRRWWGSHEQRLKRRGSDWRFPQNILDQSRFEVGFCCSSRGVTDWFFSDLCRRSLRSACLFGLEWCMLLLVLSLEKWPC